MTAAVVYARYSSHGQTEQSIEGQLAAARKYAAAKGYTIIREYIDRAQSGRTDNRKEFQLMLSDCTKRQFEVIIVWKVDRFGRNREELAFNKHWAKMHGARVEYVAETLPDGPESVILESVLEGMAEYYSIQLSQNVSRGLLESAKKHKVICGALPFGYRRGADGLYELDPKTSPFAREVFDRYMAGESINEITDWLNESGMRTPKGNPIRKNFVHRMLTNERYAGTYIFKDLIRDEDAIPALVSKEEFMAVQKSLKNRKKPAGTYGLNDYLLSGKLFCGLCGTQMVGESGIGKAGTKYTYYTCLKRKKDHACDKKNVSAEWLENKILDEIIPLILDDEVIDYIAAKTYALLYEQNKAMEKETAVEAQIKDVEKQIANLTRAIAMGAVSQSIVDQIAQLEEQRSALERVAAEEQLSKPKHITEDQIRVFLRMFKNLDYTEPKACQKLIDTFVNAIYLYDDHVKVLFNYGGQETTVSLEELKDAPECSDASYGADYLGRHPNTTCFMVDLHFGVSIRF